MCLISMSLAVRWVILPFYRQSIYTEYSVYPWYCDKGGKLPPTSFDRHLWTAWGKRKWFRDFSQLCVGCEMDQHLWVYRTLGIQYGGQKTGNIINCTNSSKMQPVEQLWKQIERYNLCFRSLPSKWDLVHCHNATPEVGNLIWQVPNQKYFRCSVTTLY
jgi:hypothetical protein